MMVLCRWNVGTAVAVISMMSTGLDELEAIDMMQQQTPLHTRTHIHGHKRPHPFCEEAVGRNVRAVEEEAQLRLVVQKKQPEHMVARAECGVKPCPQKQENNGEGGVLQQVHTYTRTHIRQRAHK